MTNIILTHLLKKLEPFLHKIISRKGVKRFFKVPGKINTIAIIYLRLHIIRNPLSEVGNIRVHAWEALGAAVPWPEADYSSCKPVLLVALSILYHDGATGVPGAGVLVLLPPSAELGVGQTNTLRFVFGSAC